MPTYTFMCDDCSHRFEKFMTMKKYTDQQTCPQCRGRKSVHRDYQSDQLASVSVKLSDDQLKLGHLAVRNGERMSKDEQAAKTYEHNKYKYNKKVYKELPTGMKHRKRKIERHD